MGRCMIGVGVVKNEADIIEANLRHNLRFLDRIIFFDHDSCDATRRILDALAAEGLPITLLARRSDRAEFGFWQGEFMSALAKLAFEQHGADHVFLIDADEFIDAPVAPPMPLRYTDSRGVDPARLLALWSSALIDSLKPPAAR
jgi:hypothetical protein